MKYLKYFNVIGFLCVIAVNAIANILPINGYTTGEISAMYPNLFVPAGITFSIWTVIYIGLAAFCIYPFMAKENKLVNDIGWLFLVTCLLNISWIIAWHYLHIIMSAVIMLVFLITLIIIYKKTHANKISKKAKWLVRKPFSIYLAWICVATIANITTLLVYLNFEPSTPVLWALSMIIATQLIVWFVNSRYKDIAFSLVIIWALIGIIIKQSSNTLNTEIVIYGCCIAIIFTTLNAFYFRYRKAIN